jgi:hypothetical protein
VAEWSKALVLKTSDGSSRPRVQIPASPPFDVLSNTVKPKTPRFIL